MSDAGKWLRDTGVALGNSLSFITNIRYDASLVKAINNMTFFYDANWSGESNTLPISFFYITNYAEVMTSEVSQKTMLFYNSGERTPDATKGGLLGVVADNIVNKPKKYKLDVIIPASYTMLDKIYQFDTYTRVNMVETRLKGAEAVGGLAVSPYVISPPAVTVIAGLIQSLITALSVEDTISNGIITSLLTLDTSNKDSLSAMWGNRTILKMKVPNGWKFKYVALESLNINRKGEDGNYFTGTIEVTELPILTVDKSRALSPVSGKIGALKRWSLSKFDSILKSIENAVE